MNDMNADSTPNLKWSDILYATSVLRSSYAFACAVKFGHGPFTFAPEGSGRWVLYDTAMQRNLAQGVRSKRAHKRPQQLQAAWHVCGLVPPPHLALHRRSRSSGLRQVGSSGGVGGSSGVGV